MNKAEILSFCSKKCAKVRSHIARPNKGRTHIPHTFQNGFRTHTHTCDRTSHVCVRARTFATHTLVSRNVSITGESNFDERIGQLYFLQNAIFKKAVQMLNHRDDRKEASSFHEQLCSQKIMFTYFKN